MIEITCYEKKNLLLSTAGCILNKEIEGKLLSYLSTWDYNGVRRLSDAALSTCKLEVCFLSDGVTAYRLVYEGLTTSWYRKEDG